MKISDILNQSVGGYSLGNIITAAITLLVCLTIVRYAVKIINRLLEVTSLDFRVRRLISNGLKMIMYVITAIIVAQGLGVNMTSFVALLSVVSLGVAMASEDLLGNFAGGLGILTSHPFAIGDLVESSGNLGTVAEIDLAHTKILNPDGQYILIPNRDLAASRIINYSALGRRRVTVKVTPHGRRVCRLQRRACQDGKYPLQSRTGGLSDQLRRKLYRIYDLLLGASGKLLGGYVRAE